VHHPLMALSPVIKLGSRHPRKKEREIKWSYMIELWPLVMRSLLREECA